MIRGHASPGIIQRQAFGLQSQGQARAPLFRRPPTQRDCEITTWQIVPRRCVWATVAETPAAACRCHADGIHAAAHMQKNSQGICAMQSPADSSPHEHNMRGSVRQVLLWGVLALCLMFTSAGCSPSDSLSNEEERTLETLLKDRDKRPGSQGVLLLYPQLEPLVEHHGLVGLARILVNHPRADFRSAGIRLVWNHRLSSLRADLVRHLTDADSLWKDKDELIAGLALSGASLEDVLLDIGAPSMQCLVVDGYAHNVRVMSPRYYVLIWQSMASLLRDPAQDLDVRRRAWRALAAARHPFLGGTMWETNETLRSMADALHVSPEVQAEGWAARLRTCTPRPERHGADFALEQLETLLLSDSKAARVEAARALLFTDQGEAKALPVLIDLVPELGAPMVTWGSVGYCAAGTLQAFEEGSFFQNALDRLPADRKQALAQLVGQETRASSKELPTVVMAFLAPDSQAPTEAKVCAARIVEAALRQQLERRSSH